MARNSRLLKRAKELRSNMTSSERILWEEIRDRKIGYKFRRQMPFAFGDYNYITDFYCVELKLVVEVDGCVHDNKEIVEHDKFREDFFLKGGYKIIRLKNEKIREGIGKILKNKINKYEKFDK